MWRLPESAGWKELIVPVEMRHDAGDGEAASGMLVVGCSASLSFGKSSSTLQRNPGAMSSFVATIVLMSGPPSACAICYFNITASRALQEVKGSDVWSRPGELRDRNSAACLALLLRQKGSSTDRRSLSFSIREMHFRKQHVTTSRLDNQVQF